MSCLFKPTTAAGKPHRHWHGKFKDDRGRWRKVRLFTDRRASEKRLADLQADAERRVAGVRTAEMDHADTPMSRHAADYLAALRREGASAGHVDIATRMTSRLLDECRWRRVADVDADSLNGFVDRLRADRTSAYASKFIARAKALLHWMMKEGRVGSDPLSGVRQNRGVREATRRDRRDLSAAELAALLTTLPPPTGRNDQARAAAAARKLAYAFGALAGLRRGELAQLLRGDVRRDGPIPFLQLRGETTKNGRADVVPLHPYLAGLLENGPGGDADEPVVRAVPDLKTIKLDLARAGIAFALPTPDGRRQRRADFHALRHTLSSLLAAARASDTARKAIMRHAATTVNDQYTHARLADTHAALCRIVLPLDAAATLGPNVRPNDAPRGSLSFGEVPMTTAGGGAGEAGPAAQTRYSSRVMQRGSATFTDTEQNPHNWPGTQAD